MKETRVFSLIFIVFSRSKDVNINNGELYDFQQFTENYMIIATRH
jgi:hypothetical protein